MTPTRPYLLRAFYDWILDNELTPYILVDAEKDYVQVPRQYVKEGQIVFNITPGIVERLDINIGHFCVEFDARFSGLKHHIYIPIDAVLAIYAKENGRGMVFDQEEGGDQPPPSPEPVKKKGKPKLKIIK